MPKKKLTARQVEVWEVFQTEGTQKDTADALGISPSTVQSTLRECRKKLGIAPTTTLGRPPTKKAPATKKVGKGGGALKDFAAKHDPHLSAKKAVDSAIERLLVSEDGEGQYVKDEDVRVTADIPKSRWKSVAKEYTRLQVRSKQDGVLYWGHESIIDQMRLIVNR